MSLTAFSVATSCIPKWRKYHWKRLSATRSDLHDWRVVPGGRHPELGGRGSAPLVRRGLTLMECDSPAEQEQR